MESKIITVTVLLLLALSTTVCSAKKESLSTGRSIYITPQNLHYLASFVDSSVRVTNNGRTIHVGPGKAEEELIRVPLAGPGELDPSTSIQITVGLIPIVPAVDSDPRVGLSDGVTLNRFKLHDRHNYGGASPCNLVSPSSDDNRLVSSSSPQTMQYVLMFEPYHRYGACYTAQDGGYVNTGTFANQLDISNGLDLVVFRDNQPEVYNFLYFIVEII